MAMVPGTYEFGTLMGMGVLAVGDGYRAKNEELGGNGPIFLRAGHVGDGTLDLAGTERFREELAPALAQKTAQAGDVLVVTKGWSTGRVAYVNHDLPAMVYSPHTSFWRSLRPDLLVPGFLRYWSRAHQAQSQLDSFRMATDVHPYLSLGAQRKLRITIPGIRIQGVVARVLSALDDKIDLNRRTNETLEAMAHAIFQSWFVDAARGLLPKGWRMLPLSEVTKYLRRGIGPAYVDEDGVCVVGQKCIRGGRLDFSKARRHDAARKSADGREIQRGDVLVNSTGVGTLGRVAQVWNLPETTVVDSHVTVVRADENVLSPIVLGADLGCREPEIEALGEGSTGQTELSRERLGKLLVLVPDRASQTRFDGTVAPLRRQAAQNQDESLTLAALRDTLLPKLLSGELRVPEAERAVEAAL